MPTTITLFPDDSDGGHKLMDRLYKRKNFEKFINNLLPYIDPEKYHDVVSDVENHEMGAAYLLNANECGPPENDISESVSESVNNDVNSSSGIDFHNRFDI